MLFMGRLVGSRLPAMHLPVCAMLAGLLAASLAVAQTDARPTFVSESVARQRIKVKVDPEYPATARQFRIAGEVVVQITIGADGKVETIDEARGNMVLQASVKTALRKWVFDPYPISGKPTRVKTSLSFNFRL